MRILIADDHELLRDVLRSYLEAEGGFAVDTAPDLPQALAAIAAAAPPYDLVVLDYAMPGMDGYAGLDKALAASFGRPVALMSGLAPPGVAERVLDSGAAGYLPKTLPARSLVNAIRFMAAGEVYMPIDLHRPSQPQPPGTGGLSARERQVLAGLCAGQANKEIARDLDLREPTIKLHVKLICRKLGARTIEFHAWAARADTVEAPERMIFDLDPDEDLDFGDVKQAAQDIAWHLADVGLVSFPMLSGGKGIHVVVPLSAPRFPAGCVILPPFNQCLLERLPVVDGQHRTGGLLRGVRAQVEDHRIQRRGFHDPPPREARQQVLAAFQLPGVLVHLGLDVPWAQDIDVDALHRPVAGERAAKLRDGSLCRAIDRRPVGDLVRGDRRDQEDPPVPAPGRSRRDHPPRALARGEEDAAEVDVRHAVEVLDRHAQRAAGDVDTGIGDHRVDGAEDRLGGIEGGDHRCLVGHVEGDRQDLLPLAASFLLELPETLDAAGPGDDARAARRRDAGEPLAEARRCARHQHDASTEVERHVRLRACHRNLSIAADADRPVK